MKQKLIKTYCFKGIVPISECAVEIEKQTSQKFIGSNKKETLNGFLNGYIDKIDGEEYTLVDVFVYSGSGEVLGEGKKIKYKLRKGNIEAVKKVKFNNHDENAKIKLLMKLNKYNE